MTAKSLIESYLPDSLKAKDEQLTGDAKHFDGGNQKLENFHETSGISTVTESDETSLMISLMESKYSENFSLLDGLSDFLIALAGKFAQSQWPIELCDAFLKCYLCWRRHFVSIEDEEHPYIDVIIIANEIILGDSYFKDPSTGTIIIVASLNFRNDQLMTSTLIFLNCSVDGDASSDFEDPMLEFMESDLDHLKLNLFHVPRITVRFMTVLDLC